MTSFEISVPLFSSPVTNRIETGFTRLFRVFFVRWSFSPRVVALNELTKIPQRVVARLSGIIFYCPFLLSMKREMVFQAKECLRISLSANPSAEPP